jgi:hypothetical protein
MVGDPTKVQGIATSSSTAGSLTSLSIVVGRPAIGPFPIEKVAEKEPTIQKAPPEHPIYSLIGRVASGFAHLEHILDLIIWELVGSDETKVACVTAQLNGARPRYDAIVSLLKERKDQAFSDLVKEVESLKGKTFDHAENRNRVIHDPWYVTDNKAIFTAQFRSMPAKDPKFGIISVDKTDLETLIETADQLAATAGDLLKKVRAAVDVAAR